MTPADISTIISTLLTLLSGLGGLLIFRWARRHAATRAELEALARVELLRDQNRNLRADLIEAKCAQADALARLAKATATPKPELHERKLYSDRPAVEWHVEPPRVPNLAIRPARTGLGFHADSITVDDDQMTIRNLSGDVIAAIARPADQTPTQQLIDAVRPQTINATQPPAQHGDDAPDMSLWWVRRDDGSPREIWVREAGEWRRIKRF